MAIKCRDIMTVVVMCTIVDAKVQRNYNCYNVYFNECLLLTPPCDEELSLRHPHGIIRREPRMHIRILGSPYLLASLSIAVANYSQKQIWGFHTNSNQIIWGFQHFSLILPCILLLTSFCIIAPQPAAMLAEVFLIAFF